MKFIKIIILVVKENYRRTNFNNFIMKSKYGKFRFFLISKQKINLFEPILNIISKTRLVRLVYSDKEFGYRNKSLRIWWNDINEVSEEFKNKENNIFICKSLFDNSKNLQLYPRSINKIKIKPTNPSIVYIGEISLNINSEIEKIWYKYENEIKNNLELICNKDFWERKDFDGYCIKSKQEIFRAFNNIIRYQGIKYLNENFQNLKLVGNDWINLGLGNIKSNHEKSFRIEKYYANICPDFGSKSGAMSLFHRTIEIIEAGGILLQVKRPDGLEVYGEEICKYITFNSLEEMVEKINYLMKNKERIEYVNKLFSKEREIL